jgi:hypothetical protein
MTIRTGQICPVSGIYQYVGGTEQIALSKGDRVPPYRGAAVIYRLVRQTQR